MTQGFPISKRLKILFAVFILIAGGRPAMAREPQAHDHFSQMIRELTKKLWADPQGVHPMNDVKEVIKKNAHKFPESHIKVFHLTELIDYIDFLNQRSQYLEKNNETLRKSLLAQNTNNALVVNSIHEIDEKTIQELEAKKELIDLQKAPAEDRADIDALSEALAEKKNLLVIKITVLQQSYDALRNLKNQWEGKEERASSQNVENLQEQMTGVSDEAAALRETIKKFQQKITSLTAQLRNKSLEAAEKDQLYKRKNESAEILQQTLDESHQRLELVHRIIQEKDDKIQLLERDLNKMRAFSNQGTETDKGEIDVLKQAFLKLQNDLQDQVQMNQDKILLLEEMITAQEKKMAFYSVDSKAKTKKLNEFNSAFVKKNKEIKDLGRVVESKDEKLLELDGIVSIYKGKLTDTRKALKEKEEQVRTLQNQLVEIKKQIYDSQVNAEEVMRHIEQLRINFANR